MKQQKFKRLPAKFNRYLVFGMWLEKQFDESETNKIEELFLINSTVEKQISFYTKFHDEYKMFCKSLTRKTKKIRSLKKKCVESIVCEATEPKIEDDTDYLWEMDSDFDSIIKEIV